MTILICLLYNCNNAEKESPYKNIANKVATYVGMQECKTCHADIYESYMRTGMGQSWGLATKEKSKANFDAAHALVYDKDLDFYYKPFWRDDSLYIVEYRLLNGDTVHKREEKIKYIVGSGQHTNSHIIDINGYLHQAPITFYTQKGTWDLAPGFEKGSNTRFDRKIETECITCHNGYPKWVEGSLNKYQQVMLGIDCERCHGPGSLHVADRRNGVLVDTSKTPDYTIVNPRRLNTEQKNNLCQRCHLQGIAVLNDNKNFFDFKPSQKLSDMANVFMPQYEHDENNMIMASHVERMKQSACYIKSNEMSCVSCHNPHVSVKETSVTSFNSACKNCHQQTSDCKESLTARNTKSDNCVTCHMPKNGSIDIPHVAVTDHLIRIVKDKKQTGSNLNEVAKFLRLTCYNNSDIDNQTKARGFLEYYERYTPSSAFLDSAMHYLKAHGVSMQHANKDLLRALFLKEKYADIKSIIETNKESTFDSWTHYRIGEAYYQLKDYYKAIYFFKLACDKSPYFLDFQSKLSTAYLSAGRLKEAKEVSQFIIKENPRYALAYFNLGYIAMQEQQLQLALIQLEKAKQLNPDHSQCLINLAVVYYQLNQKTKIIPILKHVEKLDPNNGQIKAMLNDLK